MERADKIFVILAFAAIIAMLVCDHKRIKNAGKIPNERLMLSEIPYSRPIGPAYLTSNLPWVTRQDDTLPKVSVGSEGATATGAAAV